ncbi:MAG: DUF4143 domain-containing protein [Coriobacteriales bacterium]|nr:DUF4143 domain-containing protein [Coriobacteriales bacterium]
MEQLVHYDAARLGEVRLTTVLLNLLRVIALNTAGIPSINSLTEASHADQRTVNGYLGLLEDLRVVERLPAWQTNRISRLAKSPKDHITDPGVAARLAGDNREGHSEAPTLFVDRLQPFNIRPCQDLWSYC